MKTKKIIITALMLAVGIVLGRVVHMFLGQAGGTMFSPLHIPVFICGLALGGLYGGMCGFLLPYVNMFFGMPLPIVIIMSVELLVYGIAAGMLANKRNLTLTNAYISTIIAMILGRIAAGVLIFAIVLSGGQGFVMPILGGQALSIELLLQIYIIATLPAIIIQLIIVPYTGILLRKVL